MGLISKFFGQKPPPPATGRAASQFGDSETTSEAPSTSAAAPRRDLVQVVLRDTLRKHGIPTDWIDCRVLSVMSSRHKPGMHVQFVVRQGHEELLTYIYAFQESFLQEISSFDPRAKEWLMSLAWQFEGESTTGRTMPPPGTWKKPAGGQPPGASAPVAASPVVAAAAPVAASAPVPAPAVTTAAAPVAKPTDDDAALAEDLKALFAIRDAALHSGGAEAEVDFEPTRPADALPGTRHRK